MKESRNSFKVQRTFLRMRIPAAFTLLETLIGLSVFVIAGLGVLEIIGLFNQQAALNRAMTAARAIVDAKINKVLTIRYDLRTSQAPLGFAVTGSVKTINGLICGVPDDPANTATTTPAAGSDSYAPDATDSWGGPEGTTPLTLVADVNGNAIVAGNLYRNVSTFDPLTHTLEITYSLAFQVRGRTYLCRETTLRAPDQQ